MAELDSETLKKLTQLSRIACSEDEAAGLLKDLREVLQYVDTLQELDTEESGVCSYVLADHENIFREDEIGQTLDTQEFLANAPDHIGGMIRVPPVLKGTE